MRIKTSSGFEAEINDKAADDLQFLDLICALEDGDVRAYRGLLRLLLSDEDETRLLAHVKTEDGRVPVSSISEELLELIKGIGKK